jgi:hypothetical protein
MECLPSSSFFERERPIRHSPACRVGTDDGLWLCMTVSLSVPRGGRPGFIPRHLGRPEPYAREACTRLTWNDRRSAVAERRLGCPARLTCHVHHAAATLMSLYVASRYIACVAEFASMGSSAPPAAARMPQVSRWSLGRGSGTRDTARGPGGPCSVAARSPRRAFRQCATAVDAVRPKSRRTAFGLPAIAGAGQVAIPSQVPGIVLASLVGIMGAAHCWRRPQLTRSPDRQQAFAAGRPTE